MKAVSLMQPWATLIALGAKRIETRSWATTYRGLLAIHASKRLVVENVSLCSQEPFRMALETGGYRFDAASTYNPFHLPVGMVVAVVKLVDVQPITLSNIPSEPEQSFGDYTPGRAAWILREITRLPEPISARGSLGLWEWVPPPSTFETTEKNRLTKSRIST